MIQTIKVNVRDFSGGYSYGYNSTPNPVTSEVSEREFLKLSDYDKFRDFIKNVETKQLEEGDKVYFDPKAVFPRKKFRDTYSENPIVMRADKADAIIIDKGALLNEFSCRYSASYTKLQDGTWCYTNHLSNSYYSAAIIQAQPAEVMDVLHFYRDEKLTWIDRINFLYQCAGKFVDISDINLSSEETLDTKAFDKISKMLESGTDDMKNLAVRLLTAYNYESEKHKIALLLHLNWENWRKTYKKKISVDVKTLFRKLSLDYPGYDSSYGNHLAFWSRVSLEMPNDEVVQAAFNTWFHGQIKDPKFAGKRIKIILEDEQDTGHAEQPST